MNNRRARIQWVMLAIAVVSLLAACTADVAPNASVPTATSGYRLNVSRLFGYSSGNQIKGSFRLSVVGATDIQSVDYLIDGQVIGNVNTAPFQLDFRTETYAFGTHTLSAIITTTDGRNMETADRTFEFATSQQEQQSVVSVILPLGGVVLVAVVLGLGLQFLVMQKKKKEFVPLGTARQYGVVGGAICPKCQRPTALHMLAPHFGFSKRYDICENCGKWSMMTTLPLSELRKAEAEEGKSAQNKQAEPKSEEEKLKEILDDSKYTQ